jgi:hypothetical protein
LFIALMARLRGAASCTDMALFARVKACLWQDVLVLKNAEPRHVQSVFRQTQGQDLTSLSTTVAEHVRNERRVALAAQACGPAKKRLPGP